MRKYLFFTLTALFLAVLLGVRVANPVFAQTDILDAVGTIDKPPGVAEFDEAGGIAEGDIGILFFASRVIAIVTIFAGIWTFFNVLMAGFTYVTSSGNAQSHTLVRDKLTMSVLGILLIVTVYTVSGLIGVIFFGNATYLLNPVIEGPAAI